MTSKILAAVTILLLTIIISCLTIYTSAQENLNSTLGSNNLSIQSNYGSIGNEHADCPAEAGVTQGLSDRDNAASGS